MTREGRPGALALIARGRFDLMVSDIARPHLNGYDFTAEAKRRGRTPRIPRARSYR